MKLVLDASVALKTVLFEPDSSKALQIVNDFLAGRHELLAPDFFTTEVANALITAERRKAIPIEDAEAHFDTILDALPKLVPSLSMTVRAIELASRKRIAVYDALYVVLAEDEGCCRVVTADRKLLAAFPGSTIDLANVQASRDGGAVEEHRKGAGSPGTERSVPRLAPRVASR